MLADAVGPLEAGVDGYALVLHRLAEAGPAAWTADVPAVAGAAPCTPPRPVNRSLLPSCSPTRRCSTR